MTRWSQARSIHRSENQVIRLSSIFVRDAIADPSAPKAQNTVASTEADGSVPYELSGQKQLTDMGVFLILLFGIFYFILIRPQQRRIKAHEQMLESIKKGVRVVTGGGIIGTVVKTEGEDILVVEIAQGVKVKVARPSISEVMEGSAAVAETANDN